MYTLPIVMKRIIRTKHEYNKLKKSTQIQKQSLNEKKTRNNQMDKETKEQQ